MFTFNRAQSARDSMNYLAQSLMNLGEQRQQMQLNELMTGLNQNLMQPAPVSPDVAPQPQVSEYERNRSVRQLAYDKIRSSGLPVDKQEQYFKMIDRQFPEVKPQELEYTDTETGRPLKVLEGTPEFKEVVSNPARFQRGGASERKDNYIEFTNTKTGRTIKVLEGSPKYQKVLENPAYEEGGRSENTSTPTEIEKLITAHDALPEGDKNKDILKRAIEKNVAQTGKTISIDKDGNIMIAEGAIGAGGGSLTKPTVNKIQEKMLNSSESLSRLNEIESKAFSPDGQLKKEFLTFPGKLKGFMSNMKDLANVDLSTEEQKFLGDLTQFRVAAFGNLNKTLNELSGAAVTEHEMKRLKQQLPNAGEGPFSGDGPTVFASKLKQSIKEQKMAIARLNYVQNNGFEVKQNKEGQVTGFFDDNGNQIQLENMPEVIDSAGEKILSQIKRENPGMDEKQARSLALQRVKQIFFGGN